MSYIKIMMSDIANGRNTDIMTQPEVQMATFPVNGYVLVPMVALPVHFEAHPMFFEDLNCSPMSQMHFPELDLNNYCLCEVKAARQRTTTPIVQNVEKECSPEQNIDDNFEKKSPDALIKLSPDEKVDDNKEEEDPHILDGCKYTKVYNGKGKKCRTHYKCGYDGCDRIFTKTWNFKDHANKHLGIKPYPCDKCEKSFTQKGNMEKHRKQHVMPDVLERKKYFCRFCDAKYTEKYNLRVSILFTCMPPASSNAWKYCLYASVVKFEICLSESKCRSGHLPTQEIYF